MCKQFNKSNPLVTNQPNIQPTNQSTNQSTYQPTGMMCIYHCHSIVLSMYSCHDRNELFVVTHVYIQWATNENSSHMPRSGLIDGTGSWDWSRNSCCSLVSVELVCNSASQFPLQFGMHTGG